ncbi:hypothetical protein [Natronorubrum daqingense]|uniref:Uncharacterized protein n=1 Tax=Natronorubrum daqingense TaxID=588898 RepID=A0A1N6Z4H7_9EURY|nr:hypothetical protein [Natronorubrum daqingense]APX95465.1 hypothetical protein BB347_01895 [Natronorubrum daqingense]SIR21715.1 hypothetical protein SAMN05421809_0675 [Natronorubrum daqingense]
MGSGRSLPRTPIEWYMLGLLLVVLNVGILLATGHPLPEAVAMGLFYGLMLALLIVIAAGVWSTVRGDEETPDADSTE